MSIDQFGREEGESRPEQPATIGVAARNWTSLISSSLDIETALMYLSSAERGNLRYQMEMFDRMIERDPHLQSVLQTRRMSLTQAEWRVVPADEDDPRAVAAADLCYATLMDMPSFEDNVHGLLDAIPKGIAVQEIVWSPSWGIEDLIEIPQKLLDWSQPDLRIYADGITARPMEPNRFVIHSPKVRPGSAVRRGLMRTLAIYWCIAHYALEDWAAFSEIFGVPLRLGKYPSGATSEDIETLESAVKNLGSDAAGVIIDSMMIEFPEPKSKGTAGTSTPMQSIIDHVEKKMSILVLGQNLSTQSESGSGTLAGGAQKEVREDLTRADARQVGSTFRRDLFRPLVGFNMGWDVPLPYLEWDLSDPVDQQMRAQVIVALSGAGVPISLSQVREEFNLVEPSDDADALTVPTQMPGMGMFSTAHLSAKDATGPLGSAMKANERLAAAGAAEGSAAVKSVIDLVKRLSDEARSPEELLTRIKLAGPDLEDELKKLGIDMDDFVDLTARTMVTGDLNGRVAVRAERKV